MQTHDIGRAYWTGLRLSKGAPLLHRAPVRQARWPYWYSTGIVIRLPGRRALAIGWWSKPDLDTVDETAMMLRAVGGRQEQGKDPQRGERIWIRKGNRARADAFRQGH